MLLSKDSNEGNNSVRCPGEDPEENDECSDDSNFHFFPKLVFDSSEKFKQITINAASKNSCSRKIRGREEFCGELDLRNVNI